MKKICFLLAVGVVVTGVAAFSASDRTENIKTVSTVAYEIAGAAEGIESTANLFGLPLERAWAMRGRVAMFGENLITFEPTGWPEGGLQEPGQFYYAEIDTGKNVRISSDLVSADPQYGTFETADDLSPYLSVGDLVTIGRHHTFLSVFDFKNEEEHIKNRARLLTGETAGLADEIIIFDPVTQTTQSYFYSSILDEWASAEDPLLAIEDFPIWPEQGILVRRRGEGSAYLTISGHLKPMPLAVLTQPGLNILTSAPSDQVGLRRGSAFKWDESGALVLPEVMRADSIAVLEATEEATEEVNGVVALNEKSSSRWLSALGLAPDERIQVIGDTVAIFEQPLAEPSTLLILKDDE